MKKTVLLFALLCGMQLPAQNKTQDPSVEKSMWGVQTGFLGVWGYNELRLSDNFALRTEIGVDAGLLFQDSPDRSEQSEFVLSPTLTLEPRWYYNLENRVEKGYEIDKNNGNFVSLQIRGQPGFYIASDIENIELIANVSAIPKWGIRRTIGNHFSYEVGIGLGIGYAFYDEDKYLFLDNEDKFFLVMDLHLRIGYTF